MATLEIVGDRVVQLKGFANKLPIRAVEQAASRFVIDQAPRLAA